MSSDVQTHYYLLLKIYLLSRLTGALPGPGPGAAAGLQAVPGAGLGVEVAVLTSLGPALTRRVTLTRDT